MPQRENTRPNILVFITDQQHADHLGCLGKVPVRTPNLDQLAADGALFTSCYTPCPACMPARASLFTGRANRAQGVRQNGNPLPRDNDVLPQVLRDAGYRTHAAGKLHLRPYAPPIGSDLTHEDPMEQPERREHWLNGRIRRTPPGYYGFENPDLVNGHSFAVFGDYREWLKNEHPEANDKLGDISQFNGDRYPWAEADIDPDLHYNTWVADRSIAFLDEVAGGGAPFFLWSSFPDPHSPFVGLPTYTRHYKDLDFPIPRPDADEILQHIPETVLALLGGEEGLRQKVHRNGGDNLRDLYIQTFGMIEHIDAQIGRVLNRLDELKLRDNTIILFLSDHGDQLGEHGLMHKCYWPYDACNRVPLIIRSPFARQAGHRIDTPVSLLDFAPTVLDWTGTRMPEDPWVTETFLEQAGGIQPVLPGESLRPAAETGETPKRGTALLEFDDDITPAFPCAQMRVLVTEAYKFAHYEPTGENMLFDRENDPGEVNNLAGREEYRDVERELLNQLLREILRTEPRLPRRTTNA